MSDYNDSSLTAEQIAEIAARRDAGSSTVSDESWKSNTSLTPKETKDTAPPVDEEEYLPRLIVFREVPGFDPRTLVLSYGEDNIDLQFCGCVNKYKKRFASFLKEDPGFFEQVRNAAVRLQKQGHKSISINEILDGLKFEAKASTSLGEYLVKYPHDFTFDTLPRQYLTRKLMMEDSRLFNFFELTPVKCRSNCGYPGTTEEPAEEETSSIAGF